MSEQSIPPAEAFFRRHQDNPKLYRIIYGIAWFCLAYGFALFNVGGYHRATANGGYYAEMGLFALGVLFMFSGAMLLTIKHRKNDSDFRSPAHAIMFHIKIVAIPLVVALSFSWAPIRFLWIGDSYLELTVKATEQVRKDLKFLLGDLYPEDQEGNINPETLEWTMVLADMPGISHFRVIDTNSPKVSQIERNFYSDQLNVQKFSATWIENGKEVRQEIKVDWDQAEFFGYQQNEKKYSHPICDLKAPLKVEIPKTAKNTKVLINNKRPEDHLYDHKSFGFNNPSQLPDMMRIEDNHLVIRTSYTGGVWPIYCFYNFPEQDRQYSPEPITSATIASLNRSYHKLHFILFPGLHQSNAVLDYEEKMFTRLATYEEYFDRLNDFIGLDILNTGISGMGRITPY